MLMRLHQEESTLLDKDSHELNRMMRLVNRCRDQYSRFWRDFSLKMTQTSKINARELKIIFDIMMECNDKTRCIRNADVVTCFTAACVILDSLHLKNEKMLIAYELSDILYNLLHTWLTPTYDVTSLNAFGTILLTPPP